MDVIEEFDGHMIADTAEVYATVSLKNSCPESRAGNCALVRCGVRITPCIDEEASTDPSFNFETDPLCENPECTTSKDQELLDAALASGLVCSQANLIEDSYS